MRIHTPWIAAALAALLLSCTALAQSSLTDGVLINADSMFRDLEKRIVRLEGNVQVVFQSQHLSCERATIDLKKQKIIAEGNVILTSDRAHVEGARAEFNYRENTGVVFKGFVQSGQVIFEGDVIEKVGPDHYLATNARYTACETCPPGWSFSGRHIDAEIGGYARIRRPVFRVGGVPIMILPSIIVPLKSSRQSGFLVPTMGHSNIGGLSLSESYFWAISRSQDLTLTAKWYDKRGIKTNADYRYVLSETSKGRFHTAWSQDRAFTRFLKDRNQYDGKFNRWMVDYGHYYEMPDGFVQRMDLNMSSDLRYPREYPEEFRGHGDPALENKVSISKTSDDHFGSVEAVMYTNLLKSYPLAENIDAVHRMPEINYSMKARELWEHGPLFQLDTNFVSFARNRYNYDDLDPTKGQNKLGPLGEVKRDGQFDPQYDIFRTGQRLDIKPTLMYPFQLGRKLDILPSVTFRNTQYRFYPTDSAEQAGFSPTAMRSYLQTDITARTEFSRVFGDLSDSMSNRWKHSIEPEVGYSQIPWARRPNHPFFGQFQGLQSSRQFDPINDSDIRNSNTGVQFDYNDRTFEKRLINFALTNRLTRKYWVNGEPEYRTAVLFRLNQSYDFKEAESTTPHPWSSIDALLDTRFDHFETYTTAAYNGYAKVTNLSSRVKFMLNPSNYLQVTYIQNYTFDDEYRVTGETRNIGFGLGMISRYLDATGQIDMLARTFAVQSYTYLLNIKPPGKCWNIKFLHTQVIGSDDRSIGFSFGFNFGGENNPTLF